MPAVSIGKNFELDLYGFQGAAQNKDFAGKAFQLMGRLWKLVRERGLKNKGQNVWVYEAQDLVFAGVELSGDHFDAAGMEHKLISLDKYGYYKHIGPYNLIKQAGEKMTYELKNQGYETSLPYIEVYGHWTEDQTKLETELYIRVISR
jgi:hypothetical protein